MLINMSIDTKVKENIYFNLRGLNIEFQLSDEFSSESASAGKTSTAESKICKPRLTKESAITAINLKPTPNAPTKFALNRQNGAS